MGLGRGHGSLRRRRADPAGLQGRSLGGLPRLGAVPHVQRLQTASHAREAQPVECERNNFVFVLSGSDMGTGPCPVHSGSAAQPPLILLTSACDGAPSSALYVPVAFNSSAIFRSSPSVARIVPDPRLTPATPSFCSSGTERVPRTARM